MARSSTTFEKGKVHLNNNSPEARAKRNETLHLNKLIKGEVNEYIRKSDVPVSHLVFDGYVADPQKWINKLAENGKEVKLPKAYKNRKYNQKNINTLYIAAEKDAYSTIADIPKGSADKQQVKVFDCEHISGFFKYPVEYTESIIDFLN